jgi:hypothetical protein
MSTRYDIIDAKAEYNRHTCNGQCAYPCLTKRALWLRWQQTAGKWGIEPGDNARQRDQFNARTGSGGSF